ncbi:dihydroorotase [soil metagenome]
MPDPYQVGRPIPRLEIERAWLVDPVTGREGIGRLRIEGGSIAELEWREADTGTPPAYLVVPGFFDLHVHLREPGNEDAETVASGLAAAGHGGFTTVCAMPNTTPPGDDAAWLAQMAAHAATSGSPVRLLACGTTTAGRAGAALAPLGELADAGAVGFSDDGSPVTDPALLRNALAYAGALGRPIVEHPEDSGLTRDAEAHEGLVATILGLRGWPAAGEEAAVARDLAILAQARHDAPAGASPRLHLTHLSTAGSVDLVRRAKSSGLPVTCDVTPHHLALHDGWVAGDRRLAWEAAPQPWSGQAVAGEPYDPSTRVNPPLRTPADALALAAGLCDGTVDAIATDHAPHRAVDKAIEYGDALPGISGLETAVGLLLAAVDAGVVDLLTLVRALTTGPRKVLTGPEGAFGSALPGPAPQLQQGAPADLVLIDRASPWRVSPDTLLSRGRNTPLMGRELPARVLLTLAGGRVAFADPSCS